MEEGTWGIAEYNFFNFLIFFRKKLVRVISHVVMGARTTPAQLYSILNPENGGEGTYYAGVGAGSSASLR